MNKQEVLCKVRNLKKAINWLKISEYVSNNDAIDYVANIYDLSVDEIKSAMGLEKGNLHWITFYLEDGNTRWFCTDPVLKIKMENENWFNKNTKSITIYKGFETAENDTKPISEDIYRISINYKTSEKKLHNKIYMFVKGELYKQECGNGIKVKRLIKELKQVLEVIEVM